MTLLYIHDCQKRLQWCVDVPVASFTVGCSIRASVPVPDPRFARQEFVIQKRGEQLFFRSLVPKCHTRRNGVPLELEAEEEAPLEEDDILLCGRTALCLSPKEPEYAVLARLRKEGVEELPQCSIPRRRLSRHVSVLAALMGLLCGGLGGGALAAWRAPESSPLAGDLAISGDSEDSFGTLLEELAASHLGGTAASFPETAEDLKRARAADTAEQSRRRLFRMAMDLLGRPPTRSEELELIPLRHEKRFRALSASHPEPGFSSRDTDVLATIQRFWGPGAGDAELQQVRALLSGLPSEEATARIGLRLTGSVRYSRAGFRRQRGLTRQASSLIVDLLDRVPDSPAEIASIASGLEASPRETVRTLIFHHEAESQQSRFVWEAEFFRFRGRLPTPEERARLERLLESLPSDRRRPWFLQALALHPDYASY